MFVLANFAVGLVLSIFSQIPFLGIIFSIVAGLFSLAVLVPSLAVAARRLHDTNKSTYYLLLCLIPGIGALILLYFCYLEGTSGENQYGPDPKSAA